MGLADAITTSILSTSGLSRQLSYNTQSHLTQVIFGSPITQTVGIASKREKMLLGIP